MTKIEIIVELRAIQREMRKEWFGDLAEVKHKFTQAEHHRYTVLDNLISILEAIDADTTKELAAYINIKNQIKQNNS